MFNSLASYILGNGNRNATDITQDGQQQLSGAATDETINKFKFVATNCEDDENDEWLLVEKGGKHTLASQMAEEQTKLN